MRQLIKTAALTLLPLVLADYAQAAENAPKVITLSCDGTLTRTYGASKPADLPEPLQNIGAVVNLNEQTVFFLGIMVEPKAPAAARIMAANALLDRGWGKAAQLVAIDGEIKQLVEVKLNVVTAGEPRAIEHSSPTASSEKSANQPAAPQPIDIIDLDCS
jgi:hypothetical protein